MSNSDDERLGVDFGELDDELESEEYPVDKEELVDEYGERELDFPNESMTFEEALEGYEPVDGEFQDADDVRSAVLNMVDSEAVGREEYSDRGVEGETTDETDPDESV